MRGFHHDAPVAAPSKAGDPTGPGARVDEEAASMVRSYRTDRLIPCSPLQTSRLQPERSAIEGWDQKS